MTKILIQILFHDNNIYHDIVIFFLSFKKVFIILKSLIPYKFHNPTDVNIKLIQA